MRHERREGSDLTDTDMMLVRMPGGDVVRRAVAARHYGDLINGDRILLQEEPELNEGEMVVRTMSERMPMIIKTR